MRAESTGEKEIVLGYSRDGSSPVRSKTQTASIGVSRDRASNGASILEALIAVAVLTFGIAAATLLAFANQSITLDSEAAGAALYKARDALENARASSTADFNSIVSAATTTDGIYIKKLDVFDLTPCRKEAASRIVWSTEALRPQKIELRTDLADIQGALALGGDCVADPPASDWGSPQKFAADNLNLGKPTAMDVLKKIAYVSRDRAPFFSIADAASASLGQSSGLFVAFANGFDAGAQMNAVDAVKRIDPATGDVKFYAYAAMNTPADQLKVVDATDIRNPVLVATRSLSSCVAGSYPEAWRLFYYGSRLYVTTRYTAGPEFHIFDAADPTNPTEIGIGSCKGMELGDTVNSIAVRDQMVAGSVRRFVYFATDESDKEVRVFDVTGDAASEVAGANQDLPGVQNARSVFLLGNKLYVGRDSSPGPDFYVFDATNPLAGLPLLGAKDIGTGAIALRVAGRFAFIGTPKAGQELQVWNIADPATMTNVAKYKFSGIIAGGVEYEPDIVYAASSASDSLRMVYSP